MLKHDLVLVDKGQTLLQSDPSDAIECFEKAKEICRQLVYASDYEMVLKADVLIAKAKAKLPGVDKKEALENLLQQQQHFFTALNDMYGEEDSETLCVGRDLSQTLIELEQFDEAEHLLMSLHRAYGQVHGRYHPYTKSTEEILQTVSGAM
jgi:hypothetical protein